MSSAPIGTDDFVIPRRSSEFGLPPSTIQTAASPSSPTTSMWIHECGLIISTFVTVPVSATGRSTSNSAANA